MGTRRPLALALLGLLLVASSPARGDGGELRCSRRAGPFLVSVFSAPVPMRAGPVDVSVLVQDAETRQPILDAEVGVAFVPSGRGAAVEARAAHAAARNRLLYGALVDLPATGAWTLVATLERKGRSARLACSVDAAPPVPAPLAHWPALALPPLAIGLFALRERLRARARRTAQRGSLAQ
jgi:hypothetical protein